MTYDELMELKRNTADSVQKKSFDRIELKEGMGFIDSLEINYLDGRNCGYDMHIVARGLEFKDGKVETFEIEKLDVPFDEFIKDIKYPFISTGVLMVTNEIWKVELLAEIGSCKRYSILFKELSCMADQTFITSNTAYEKMLFIHGETPDEEPVANLSL